MNVNDVKIDNCNRIYAYLHKNKIATKKEISINLELSLPTVSKTLISLAEQHLIECDEKISNKTGGRNPVAYAHKPEAKVAVGIDVARYHIKTVIVDLNGNILHRNSIKIQYQRSEEQLKDIGNEVKKIVAESSINPNSILGVGIAVPGLICYKKNYVVDGRVVDNTGITNEDYARYIPYRTQLIHDSEAAGFCEIFQSPELSTAAYFVLGHSVGTSIFIKGERYRGEGLFSGEVGHLNLVPDGEQCYCGRKGCFDPYINVRVLSQYTGGSISGFFKQLEQKDQMLVTVWERYLDNLAQAITEVRMMLGCKIILGSDVGAHLDRYMDTIRERVDAISPFGEKSINYLVPCRKKEKITATGAALYFVQDFLDNCMGNANETLREFAL